MQSKTVVITAKYRSTCTECRGVIAPGDSLTKRGDKWVHVTCPTPRESTLTFQRSIPAASECVAVAVPPNVQPPAGDTNPFTPSPSPDSSEPSPAGGDQFVPSVYQQAIFDWMKTGEGNLIVEAVAGSGKTRTIVEALKFTDSSQLVAFVAFNSHIAKELKSRAPSHVYTATLHSLGFSAIRAAFGKVEVDEYKLDKILDEFIPRPDRYAPQEEKSENKLKRGVISKLVSMAKATLVDATNESAVMDMCDRYGIDLNGYQKEFVALLPDVLNRCMARTQVIDFDDMVWLPVVLNLDCTKYDWLFVDECQDLNKTQIALVLLSIALAGRVVCVGDRRQSLYGFRGADTEAVENIIAALNAKTMPLSICYRCPSSHLDMAREIVPQIEARPNAPEGNVQTITEANLLGLVKLGDMVICRINAPLVPVAFELIRRGIKAVVRGRDIGKNLAQLSDNLGGETMEEFYAHLGDYSSKEMQRLEYRNALDSQVQSLTDKVNTLYAVAQEVDQPSQIGRKIESIFSDDVEGIVLSSVHRAKGLEANRVFILRPELMPMVRENQQAWEKVQELNCKYVALTRSKSELYLVN